MKIALFSLTYGSLNGEGGIATDELIGRLNGLDFNVFTYRFAGNQLPFDEAGSNFGITVVGGGDRKKRRIGIWKKMRYAYEAWQEAERAHRAHKFDAIWAINASYGGLAALLFKMKHPKLPLFLTLQEDANDGYPLFAKKIIKIADFIQCSSQYLADSAVKMGARCPIEVVSGGVDIELFQTKYTEQEIRSLRNNLDIKEDYVVLTTARLVYKNGIDILIRAISKLKEKRPGIKLLIIGDGPEAKKLKVQSKKLKVDNDILFLGQILHKDLPIYFRVSDVFVKPARFGGSGYSLLEAMAAKVPVIATPNGGAVDFIRDPSTGSGQVPNGFFCKPEDPDDLSDKINFVLGHPDVKGRAVANAENLVSKYYSWDTVAKKIEEIFKRLTGKQPKVKSS